MSRKISHSLISGRAGAGTGGQGLKIEWDSTNDGELHWMDVDESSLEPLTWYGDRGLFGGGEPSGLTEVIDYITISSTGDAADFGDLVEAKAYLDGTSNGTRGVWFGGFNTERDRIQYVTVSTLGNATDFGDLTVARYSPAVVCDGTRGVAMGGLG